jgi:hypothetical protein
LTPDVDEGPNARDGKGSSNLDPKKNPPPISQLKRLDTRHNKHWPFEGKRIGVVHVLLKTNKQEQNSCVQNDM